MAAAHDIFCGICDKLQTTKHAVKWCPECDEGLCAECEKYHFVSKFSCHHAVISIEDFKALPTNISKIEHYCEEHQREFKNYCPQHDKLCCPLCIAKIHKKCTELMALEDIVKDAKTSTLLYNIEQSLHNTKVNIENIIKDREQNMAKIKGQRQKFQDEIHQIRHKVNTNLDEIERKTLEKLNTTEQSIQFATKSLLSQLKERYESVEDLQKTIKNVKSYASDLQAFYAIKQLESPVDQEYKYVMSIVDGDCLQQIDLKCDINEIITATINISAFGSVNIKKGNITVELCTEKSKEAQILSVIPKAPRDVNTIKLKPIRKFDIPMGKKKHCVTGCAILPNGNLVIADCDKNKRIIIVNDHGFSLSQIFVSSSKPFDVAYLHGTVVAFSSFGGNIIDILDTESTAISKFSTTNGIIDGITNQQGAVIYCDRQNGIQKQQLDAKSSQTIVNQSFPRLTYVTTDETNIYHTNNNSDTVTCYSMTGDKLWEFKDESILKCPYGVAVDKHSNIYIASNGNNSIIVISSDGKNGKQLLKEGDFKDPRGLSIDRDKIFVACYAGTVLLYEISFSDL